MACPPRNPSALAGAILDALGKTDEARRRTTEGHQLAKTLFDVERSGAEVAAIYERILARPAKLL